MDLTPHHATGDQADQADLPGSPPPPTPPTPPAPPFPPTPLRRPGGLEGMLCFDLYAASHAMTAAYRPLLARHDLTYPQYLVLVALWAGDDVPIKHLAAALHLDHGTLSPLLRRLEDRGLLTRRRGRDDGRAVRVRLTPRGDALRPLFDDVQCAMGEAVGVSAEEMAATQQVLRRVHAHLTREPARPSEDDRAG